MTREQALELLRGGPEGVANWNAFREGTSFWFDLSGADLSGADLSGADLRRAKLRMTDLSEADLRGADLSAAKLSAAKLGGADLSGANLRGAKLTFANLRGAKLIDAKLSWADLRGADLREANLSGAELREVNLSGARLSGAELRGADLRGVDLSKAKTSEPESDASYTLISIVPKKHAYKRTLMMNRKEQVVGKRGAHARRAQEAIDVYIDPGQASVEQIQAVFDALSDLHRACGGFGLLFKQVGRDVYAMEEVKL